MKTRKDLEEAEQDITRTEMMRAIQEASNGKAAGGDDIPYEMVKNLGPRALEMLLTLYRKCWRGEGIPTFWRVAVNKALL